MTTTAFENNNFSITDLIGKVRDIALEHPMTIYERDEPGYPGEKTWCSYVSGHSSGVGDGCMFGQILPWDFVELDAQADIEEVLKDHLELPEAQTHSHELDDDGDPIPSQEMDWLSDVQRNQDHGFTWARAVKEADIHHPLD